MTYVIRAADRSAFKRCRRAWDLGSRSRGNFEPTRRRHLPDLDRAVRDGLAVYYFPGMWEWDRNIVRPLALDGLARSLHDQRVAAQGAGDMQEGADAVWEQSLQEGKQLLERYFVWAPTVDDFVPIRVETDFSVRLPDPAHAGRDLASPSGEPIHYEGRIHLLVVDDHDNYWMVVHRTVTDEWADLDQLLLDDYGTSFCWAWELFYLGMRITGVIYNELAAGRAGLDDAVPTTGPARTDERASHQPGQPGRHRRMYVKGRSEPGPALVQEGSPFTRRTRVRRSQAELDRMRTQAAYEALDMSDPAVRVYPNPSEASCRGCEYRHPCIALNQGHDAAEALAGGYRKRSVEQLEEGRLGGVTWSMNRGAAPPRFRGERGIGHG